MNRPQRRSFPPSEPVSQFAALRLIEEGDYAAVRRAIRVGLERYPGFFVCGEALDGLDAIEKATELRPDFILLDLSMPRMNAKPPADSRPISMASVAA